MINQNKKTGRKSSLIDELNLGIKQETKEIIQKSVGVNEEAVEEAVQEVVDNVVESNIESKVEDKVAVNVNAKDEIDVEVEVESDVDDDFDQEEINQLKRLRDAKEKMDKIKEKESNKPFTIYLTPQNAKKFDKLRKKGEKSELINQLLNVWYDHDEN